jgi:hypothetical protein
LLFAAFDLVDFLLPIDEELALKLIPFRADPTLLKLLALALKLYWLTPPCFPDLRLSSELLKLPPL